VCESALTKHDKRQALLGGKNREDIMARGHQKEQSKAKNAKKQDAMAKQKGHSAATQKKAAAAALVYVCTVCRSQMPDPKTYKQHFENKHPKSPLPDELKDVQS